MEILRLMAILLLIILLIVSGSKVIYKDNFAVMTGSMNLEAKSSGYQFQTSQKQLDFPEGFNRDNCIVLAFGTKANVNLGYNYGDISSVDDAKSFMMLYSALPKTITLGGMNNSSNKIIISVGNYNDEAITIYYKIVLMKIS